jgi:hypothetical protein
MAHIANRSRFRVTVKNKPDVTRHFSFDKLDAVEAYMKELRARSLKPKVVQLDESWLVRIRDKGHKPLEATFSSEAAAIQFIDKTTEERKRGLFIDYTSALKVTFADLIVRFLLDEAWKTKSGQVLAYSLEGWLFERLDGGHRRQFHQRGDLALLARPCLGVEHPFEEVGEAQLLLGGVLRDRRPLGVQPRELHLRAQRLDTLVLQVHAATSRSACSSSS